MKFLYSLLIKSQLHIVNESVKNKVFFLLDCRKNEIYTMKRNINSCWFLLSTEASLFHNINNTFYEFCHGH